MSVTIPPPGRPFELDDAAGTHKFTVAEYHRLLDIGVLSEGEPVELLDGYIVKKWDRSATPGFPQWSGLRRFTVAEYHAMIEAGVLTSDDPVELLEGYLVLKLPQNMPHGGTIQRLNKRLVRTAPAGWEVRCQLPITLAGSEPGPDFAVVRGDDRTYDTRHPGPADFGLLIEVADSSVLIDRRDKGRIYARAGIPVYWIVNVADRQVEVYTDPQPGATPPAYAARTSYLPGQDVPILLDGQAATAIPAADLLP